jgi:hypothetical protein
MHSHCWEDARGERCHYHLQCCHCDDTRSVRLAVKAEQDHFSELVLNWEPTKRWDASENQGARDGLIEELEAISRKIDTE